MAGKSKPKMKPGPKPKAKRKPVKVQVRRMAAALAGLAAPAIEREAEQLALLPLPPVKSPVGLDQAPEGPHRGPGRPLGSRNRRTEETVAYLLARYQHPAVVLAETYSRPTPDLARALDCKLAQAYEFQQAAAIALLPYVASKMPQALEIDQRNVVALTLIVSSDMAPPGSPTLADMPQVARVIEYQRNQEDSVEPEPGVGQQGVGR